MHGGTICVESKYGAGTKFSIRLPVKLADAEDTWEKNKLPSGIIDSYVERIKFEFSDIYN
jgi:hypothetical protein